MMTLIKIHWFEIAFKLFLSFLILTALSRKIIEVIITQSLKFERLPWESNFSFTETLSNLKIAKLFPVLAILQRLFYIGNRFLQSKSIFVKSYKNSVASSFQDIRWTSSCFHQMTYIFSNGRKKVEFCRLKS